MLSHLVKRPATHPLIWCVGLWLVYSGNPHVCGETCGQSDETWHVDYTSAVRAATRERRMLLIHFCPKLTTPGVMQFDREILANPEVGKRLRRVTKARLSADARITVGGKTIMLLEHPAFVEMQGQPGLAIVDLAHPKTEHYHRVVSQFPFVAEHRYTSREVATMLDLPAGSLTQRTLIFAVRVHPDQPGSTDGSFSPDLAQAATSHAGYQARIGLQGHHFWESRFHQINSRLPQGLMAREVCAESWPRQGLLQAALECVRCWRFSSGHWSAVSSRPPVYGYDMKLGANGIWYATGIFGGRP